MSVRPEQNTETLFRKAAQYCASDEHCRQDLYMKLQAWGATPQETEDIIGRLIKEGYINEVRYTKAFARGKFRNNHWGKIQIGMELRRKGIPDNLIHEALETEIDQEEYRMLLRNLLEKKLLQLQSKNRDAQLKALRYAASKGFETGTALEIINELMH